MFLSYQFTHLNPTNVSIEATILTIGVSVEVKDCINATFFSKASSALRIPVRNSNILMHTYENKQNQNKKPRLYINCIMLTNL